MKIGFLQFEPLLGKPSETIEGCEALIQRAPEFEVLVLPELANSGYNFRDGEEAGRAAEVPEESPFVAMLQRQARDRGALLVSGFCEREGNLVFNSSVAVDGGGIVARYRKIHLFGREKVCFSPGPAAPEVFSWKGVRLGILVCFDWIFPEVWRILALQKADVVCHPSNLVLPGLAQRGVPIHALMNRFYVVTANRIGTERELTFTGNSLIADPRGELLASATKDEVALKVVEVDLEKARDKRVTEFNDVLGDRRPELYGQLTEAR